MDRGTAESGRRTSDNDKLFMHDGLSFYLLLPYFSMTINWSMAARSLMSLSPVS